MLVERQKPVPIRYRDVILDSGLRLDMLIDNRLIVELKACERVTEVHQAQVLSYLRLTGLKQGLLINFNVPVLHQGVRRIVNAWEPEQQ